MPSSAPSSSASYPSWPAPSASDNPFADQQQTPNPFDDAASTYTIQSTPAAGGGGAALADREAALSRREEELARRERAVEGLKPNNWPPCASWPAPARLD